jgi:hypothetical protein
LLNQTKKKTLNPKTLPFATPKAPYNPKTLPFYITQKHPQP